MVGVATARRAVDPAAARAAHTLRHRHRELVDRTFLVWRHGADGVVVVAAASIVASIIVVVVADVLRGGAPPRQGREEAEEGEGG